MGIEGVWRLCRDSGSPDQWQGREDEGNSLNAANLTHGTHPKCRLGKNKGNSPFCAPYWGQQKITKFVDYGNGES